MNISHGRYVAQSIEFSIRMVQLRTKPIQVNGTKKNKILICEFHFTSCFSLLHTHTRTEETFPRKIQLFFGMLFSANKTNMLLVWPLARPWIPKNSPLNNSWLFSFIVKLLTVFFSLSLFIVVDFVAYLWFELAAFFSCYLCRNSNRVWRFVTKASHPRNSFQDFMVFFFSHLKFDDFFHSFVHLSFPLFRLRGLCHSKRYSHYLRTDNEVRRFGH